MFPPTSVTPFPSTLPVCSAPYPLALYYSQKLQPQDSTATHAA